MGKKYNKKTKQINNLKKEQHESQDTEKLQSNMIEIKINVNKLLFFIIFISFSFIMSNELNFSARNIDNR